jgi:hypothetical protein
VVTKAKIFSTILGLGFALVTGVLKAADPAVIQTPPAPTHRFFDKQNIVIFSIDAAIMAADFATTRRALEAPGAHEANPLMKSEGPAIAMKFAGVGAGMGIAYALHKSGHHRAERIVPVILGIPSGFAAVHNAGIHP